LSGAVYRATQQMSVFQQLIIALFIGKLSDIFHIDLTLKGSNNFIFHIRL
jgi:hypothetical protein